MWQIGEVHTGFWWGDLREGEVGTGESMEVQWTFKSQMGSQTGLI